jgi:hypothetical protein
MNTSFGFFIQFLLIGSAFCCSDKVIPLFKLLLGDGIVKEIERDIKNAAGWPAAVKEEMKVRLVGT